MVRAPAQGRRGVRDRRAWSPGPCVPRPGRDRGGRGPRRGPTPSTRDTASCRRTRGWPRPAPRQGSPSSARRPTCSPSPATRRERSPPPGRPACRRWPRVAPCRDVDELVASADGAALPAVRQGRRRWRWPRHAAGRRPRPAAGGGRDLHARGGRRVRRPDRLHRAGRRRAAAHRGADPGRRLGRRDPPLRAGLLGPAAAPEGRRDRARAEPRPGAAPSGSAPTP